MSRILLAIALSIIMAAPAVAQVTRVQGVTANGTSGTGTVTTTFGSNVTIGNRIVIIIRACDTADAVDTGEISNSGTPETWTVDAQTSNANARIAFASTTATSAWNAVTYNPAAVLGRCGLDIMEFSGLGAYGSVVTTRASGSSATPLSNAFTPGAATGLAVSGIVSSNAQTWEADFATNAAGEAAGRFWSAYDIDPPASSQTATSTQVSSAWEIDAAWYQAAAAGATCSGGLMLMGVGKC